MTKSPAACLQSRSAGLLPRRTPFAHAVPWVEAVDDGRSPLPQTREPSTPQVVAASGQPVDRVCESFVLCMLSSLVFVVFKSSCLGIVSLLGWVPARRAAEADGVKGGHLSTHSVGAGSTVHDLVLGSSETVSSRSPLRSSASITREPSQI